MKNFLPKIINRKNKHLNSVEDVLNITQPKNRVYIGVRQVELDKIIGSEGRAVDFDLNYVPIKNNLKSRLDDIRKLFDEGFHFPPISVYKIDDFYFVRDGNHRVSVAKSRGQIYIDAEITEYILDVPITKELTDEDKLIIKEHSNFLKATGLIKLGRDALIILNNPEYYKILLNIISDYTELKNQADNTNIDITNGAHMWYHQVFLPFAIDAYRFDLLNIFPFKTTGDLYIWVQKNSKLLDGLSDKKNNFLSSILKKDIKIDDKHLPNWSTNKKYINLLKKISNQNQDVESNFISEHHIALAVTSVIIYVSNPKFPKLVTVRRRYHPSEGQWSLPVVILRGNEEIQGAANRCYTDVLGIDQKFNILKTILFDKKDRYPFGRAIAVCLTSIIFDIDKKIKFEAGNMAQTISLYGLEDVPNMVFDHRNIFRMSIDFMQKKSNSLRTFRGCIKNNISFDTVYQTLRAIKSFHTIHLNKK